LEDCTVFVPGKLAQSSFDIGRIFDTRAAYRDRVKEMLQAPIEPTYSLFTSWQAGIPIANNSEKKTYWLTSGDRCLKLDKLVFKILQLVSEHRLTLREALSGLNGDLQARLMEYFRQLESQELIVFHDPSQSWEKRRRVVLVDYKTPQRVVRVMPQGKLGGGRAASPTAG
jgi:hypothetical protein